MHTTMNSLFAIASRVACLYCFLWYLWFCLDPSWASINRGILLCAECCSIHRSLGRHISQVKSLRQGSWSPAVLNYVNAINAHGANSVWEHCLMDAVAPKNLKRKPSPKDPLHPTKAEFIRAKHVNLSFILKPNPQQVDGDGSPVNLEQELSKQLHASVRSANLETSLRFLVQGADPNYFHEVRSTFFFSFHFAHSFREWTSFDRCLIKFKFLIFGQVFKSECQSTIFFLLVT